MIYREANKFLRHQEKLAASTKPKSKQILMKENRCNADTPMVIKSYLKKTFADILATELEEKIIHALCGPRSKQKVDVAQRVLNLLVNVTGEKCTLQNPKSGTQRILVFMADQAAVWMIDAVDAADKIIVDRKEKILQGIEDGGKGDANYEEEDKAAQSESNIQIIHKKKRPSNISIGPEGSGDGSEAAFESGKKPPKGRKSEADSNTDSHAETGAKKKRHSSRGERAKSALAKLIPARPQRKEGPKTEGEKKPKGASQRQSQAGGKGSSAPTQAKRSGSDEATSKAADAKSSAKPGTAQSSQSRSNVPPRKPSQTSASKQDVNKSAGPTRTSSRQVSKTESRPTTNSPRGSKSSDRRQRTASELHREKIGEIISEHISNLMKEESTRETPRAEALRDVISKKLEGSAGVLDQKGIDAIKDASVLIAAYIDKQAETVELEYGTAPPPKALAQRGKGPVYSLKPSQSSFAIREITQIDAAAKIARARGRPTSGTITLSKGGFNPKESQEWAKWANDVANMADKWSKWIDSTVSKAVTSAEMKKAGQEVPEWLDWKERAGEEALEWRRNQKMLIQSAALFQDKVYQTKKPGSAPVPSPSQVQKDSPKKT